MGTVPLHELSARQWAMMSSIGPTRISTIGWSRDHRGIRTTIVSDALLWKRAKLQLAFVVTRDELQKYFRPRSLVGEAISLSQQRRAFLDRLVALQALLQ